LEHKPCRKIDKVLFVLIAPPPLSIIVFKYEYGCLTYIALFLDWTADSTCRTTVITTETHSSLDKRLVRHFKMPKPSHLYSFQTIDDLASALRSYVLKCQKVGLERHDAFKVAVSGGSLPKTLAKALLTSGDGSPDDEAQFAKWEIFFADERAVPLDHEDSNYKLLKEELLDKIPAGAAKPTVFTIDTQHMDDVQEMADQYEQLLVKSFAAKDSVKLPAFDLILLGCGPDGHTCSLFPGHPLLRETDGWVLPISDSPKPPKKRITLSLPVVHQGNKIAFVATGEGKKDVLHKIFDTEEGHTLPCGLVNQGAEDKVSWFCDASATEGVSHPKRGNL